MEDKGNRSSNKNITSHKLFYPTIAGLILLVFLVGGVMVLSKKSDVKPQVVPDEQSKVKNIKAEDIGLSLKPRVDSKAVILTISKLNGILSVEYEVSYDAEVTEGGQTQVVPRGVTNSPIEVKSSDREIKREVELGTCSRNVCKYDNVKSEVKFVIKVNYKNGDTGSVEKSIAL